MNKQKALPILNKITEEGLDPYDVSKMIEIDQSTRDDCPDAEVCGKKLWTEYLAGKTRRCCTLDFCDGTSSTACSGWQEYKP